jgi:DNA segregation ATPase FtsK/SpoIIIE-like protein
VIENQKLSMRDIQKKFHLAYNAAGRIVVWMEEKGYITPYYGGKDEKPREFLITLEQIDALYGQDN